MPPASRGKPKFSALQRDAIYRAQKKLKSGEKVRRVMRTGFEDLAPFDVSAASVREIARREAADRDELYNTTLSKLPPNEAVNHLAKRLLITAEKEALRLEHRQSRGQLDGNQLGKLATALGRIGKLVDERANAGAGDDPPGDAKKPDSPPESEAPPPSFAEGLLERGDADPAPDAAAPDAVASPALADVVVGSNGGSFARLDRRPLSDGGEAEQETVPADHQTATAEKAERDAGGDGSEADLVSARGSGDPIPLQGGGEQRPTPRRTSTAPIPV